MGGGGGNLWKEEGVAKDLNPDKIPSNLTLGGVRLAPGQIF